MTGVTPSNSLRRLASLLTGGGKHGDIFLSTVATIALKAGAAGLAFVASLLYARMLGPRDFGLYAYVIAWTAMLTIPAGIGIPQYLVREGAKAPQSLLALRRWADMRILWAGITAALLLCGLALVPQAGEARWLFVMAAPLPLLANLGAVRQSLVQALGWIARSQWPKLLLAPAVTIVCLVGIWEMEGRITLVQLMTIAIAAALLPIFVNSLQLARATAPSGEPRPTHVGLAAALPFVWLSGLSLIMSRTDLIMLGALRGAEEAGVYAVAARASELLSLIAGAANLALAPTLAKLHQDRSYGELQHTMTFATRRMFLSTLPIALAMITLAPELLRLFYGAAYVDGSTALRILGVAQLLSIMSGPLGTLLSMTGLERLQIRVMAACAAINVLLNLLLIPHLGATGASIATCCSLLLARVGLVFLVRSKLGLRPPILGL